ncbi:MAG: hypothetical protein PHD43_08690 [Methylococcales bacterium]|nr:hypothetical protein [Methylococcales bacterium]
MKNGTSKMKRLRAFWEIEDDKTVGKLLNGLLSYADSTEKIDQNDKNKAQVIINRLLGKKETTQKTLQAEAALSVIFLCGSTLSLFQYEMSLKEVVLSNMK